MDEAIVKAKQLVDGHDIEVWSGARLVIHLKRKPDKTEGAGDPAN
jgi:hypothetical protein